MVWVALGAFDKAAGATQLTVDRKSQILLQYAHEKLRSSPMTAVFWVYAGSRGRFAEDYRKIAKAIDIKDLHNPSVDWMQLVKQKLEEDYEDFLMIIDNADDMAVFYDNDQDKATSSQCLEKSEAGGAFRYIPEKSQGSIIYSTRNKANALRLTGNDRIIPVEALTTASAIELLGKKMEMDVTKIEEAGTLVAELECLPLAIVQASSYMRELAWSIPEYLEHYKQKDWGRLQTFLNHNFRDRAREPDATNAVLKTWIITFTEIERKNARAAEILCLTAFLDRQSIPVSLLRRNREEAADLRDSIGILKAFSLFSSANDDDSLTSHRLVQISTRFWLEDCGELDIWAQKSLDLVCQEFPGYPKAEHSKSTMLIPHVQSVVDHLDRFLEAHPSLRSDDVQSTLHRLTIRALNHLSDVGLFSLGLTLAQQVIRIFERDSVLKREGEVLEITSMIAYMYCCQGKQDQEAEEISREVVKKLKRRLSPTDDVLLDSKNVLALVLMGKKNYSEAEALLTEISQALVQKGEEGSHGYITIQINLAGCRRRRGEVNEAETMLQETALASERLFGEENPASLKARSRLVRCLVEQEKYADAEPMCRQTLERQEKILSPDHPDTLDTVSWLGRVLLGMSQYEEAAVLFQRALDGKEKIFGRESNEYLDTLHWLGRCRCDQGRYEIASELFTEVISASERLHGREAEGCMNDLFWLAKCRFYQEQYQESLVLFREVLSGVEMLEQPRQETIAIVVRQIAECLHCLGRFAEALPYYERAVPEYLRLYGSKHKPYVALSKHYALARKKKPLT